ncbi:MAG: hypothetical protein KDA63_10445 [Planctomycetales bacterium]|nr:hypothetical protein [Planctomycetales bacterium]
MSAAARLRRRVALGVAAVVALFLLISVAGFDPTGVGALIRSLFSAAVTPKPRTDGGADAASNLLIGIGPLVSAVAMTMLLAMLRLRWAIVVAVIVAVLMLGFIVQTLFVQSTDPGEYQAYRTWYLFALFSAIAGVAGTVLGCAISYARERL